MGSGKETIQYPGEVVMEGFIDCEFDWDFSSLAQLEDKLKELGADYALLKELPKNANDKNQIYMAADLRVIHPAFSLEFQDRGASTSRTKRKSVPGRRIPEAVFTNFSWLRSDGREVPAKCVKAIIYAQYPEARLSGFLSTENTMPRALTVEYTKEHPKSKRLLIIARRASGSAVGIFVTFPSVDLLAEIKALPGAYGSKVCKEITLNLGRAERLESDFKTILGKSFDGCRLDSHGNTLPFNGTQVCGYTLEHALGIKPNSDQHGDIYGIELKVHTMPKVTLFTPEPDFGEYADDFNAFMVRRGYMNENGDYRLTGIHRAGIRCKKSELTLKVRTADTDKHTNEVRYADYDPESSFTAQMDSLEVVLLDDHGEVAAGWSLERILNNWDNKHNEVVYVSAVRSNQEDEARLAIGYKFKVAFGRDVTWCSRSSAQRLFNAIQKGTVFLDPAPKYCPDDPSRNKRRSQWRVSNIDRAVNELYEIVAYKTIS
jgi:hypothetical protein